VPLGKHVAVAADEAGFVSALPQRSGAAVTRVEGADIQTSECLHHAGDCTGRYRCRQQVHVIGHQNVDMNRARVPCRNVAQRRKIAPAIFIIVETVKRLLPRCTTCCATPGRSGRGSLDVYASSRHRSADAVGVRRIDP
jgi:coenzyme F420-reducing hydrogenase delta subunit